MHLISRQCRSPAFTDGAGRAVNREIRHAQLRCVVDSLADDAAAADEYGISAVRLGNGQRGQQGRRPILMGSGKHHHLHHADLGRNRTLLDEAEDVVAPCSDATVRIDGDRRVGTGASMRCIRHQPQEAFCLQRTRYVAKGRMADDLGVDPSGAQIGDRLLVGRAEVAALAPTERIDQAHIIHEQRTRARASTRVPDGVRVADESVGEAGLPTLRADCPFDQFHLLTPIGVLRRDPLPRVRDAPRGAGNETNVRPRDAAVIDEDVAVQDGNLPEAQKFEHCPARLQPSDVVLGGLQAGHEMSTNLTELLLVKFESPRSALPHQPVGDAPVERVAPDPARTPRTAVDQRYPVCGPGVGLAVQPGFVIRRPAREQRQIAQQYMGSPASGGRNTRARIARRAAWHGRRVHERRRLRWLGIRLHPATDACTKDSRRGRTLLRT